MAVLCSLRVRGANVELAIRHQPEPPAAGDRLDVNGSVYEVIGVNAMVGPPDTPEVVVDLVQVNDRA